MNKIIKLFASVIGAAGAGFLSQMILASFFEKKFVGDFLWAISTATTLGALFGLGYSGLILAEGKDNPRFVKNVSYAIKIPLTLSLLVACALIVVYLTVDIYAFKSMYLLILTSVIVFSALQPLGVCYYQINMQPQKTGNFQLVTNVGRLISLCIVLLTPAMKSKESFILFFYAFLGALNVFHIIYLWQKKTKFSILKISLPDAVVSVKNTFGYSINVFFSIYSLNAIVIFSGFYLPAHSVAQIAFAMAFMQLLHLLPTTLYSYFLQNTIHEKKADTYYLKALIKKTVYMALVIQIAVYFCSIYIIRPAMISIFNGKYDEAMSILVILCGTVFFRFISTCLGSITNLRELISKKRNVQIFIFILSVFTYQFFGLYFNHLGFYVTYILLEVIVCVLYAVVVFNYLRKKDKK